MHGSNRETHNAFPQCAHRYMEHRGLGTALTDADHMPCFVCAHVWVRICMDVDVKAQEGLS